MQRLLRLVAERDSECGRLCAKAIEKAAFSVPSMPLKQFMLKVYEALPGATYTDKEEELLCQKSSEFLTEEEKKLSIKDNLSMSM
jgi:hypothetical protein